MIVSHVGLKSLNNIQLLQDDPTLYDKLLQNSNTRIPTLKAFEMLLFMKSRTNPPARVPTIPQTTVIPPNIISASACQK